MRQDTLGAVAALPCAAAGENRGAGPMESIRDLLGRKSAGGEVTVRGWLRTARHAKQMSFLEVNDGSCLSGLQVVAEPGCTGWDDVVRSLGTGCAVVAKGELVDSPGKGQRYELHAGEVTLVGDVGDDYPLQKKRHGFEFLRTIAATLPSGSTSAST